MDKTLKNRLNKSPLFWGGLGFTSSFFFYFFFQEKLPFLKKPLQNSLPTETVEEKLDETLEEKSQESMPILMHFESMSVSIAPTLVNPRPGVNVSIQNRSHTLTTSFSLELTDKTQEPLLQEARPLILNQFTSIIAKKNYDELNTFYGRTLLRTELLVFIDGIIETHGVDGSEGSEKKSVKNLYFTEFILQ